MTFAIGEWILNFRPNSLWASDRKYKWMFLWRNSQLGIAWRSYLKGFSSWCHNGFIPQNWRQRPLDWRQCIWKDNINYKAFSGWHKVGREKQIKTKRGCFNLRERLILCKGSSGVHYEKFMLNCFLVFLWLMTIYRKSVIDSLQQLSLNI